MKSSDSSSSDNSTSSSDTITPDTTAPTVSSVSTTADNQSSVAITDNITVTFSEAMDTTYITTNTSDTYCSGTIRVSSSSDNFSTGNCVKMSSSPSSSNSNKTFTLDPYDNLTRTTTYLTRVTTGVKDTAGNAMSSEYETSSGFTTDNSSITVSNSLTSGKHYWRVVASDPKGGSAQSETWSFTVQ
jgi:methionine-rich copper-binding protein CopC